MKPLTENEEKFLALWNAGASRDEIAAQLNIKPMATYSLAFRLKKAGHEVTARQKRV